MTASGLIQVGFSSLIRVALGELRATRRKVGFWWRFGALQE
jgi:hypothetical protein